MSYQIKKIADEIREKRGAETAEEFRKEAVRTAVVNEASLYSKYGGLVAGGSVFGAVGTLVGLAIAVATSDDKWRSRLEQLRTRYLDESR